MLRRTMFVLLVSACASGDGGPARVTVEDFRQLRWIEGTWRGTGGGIAPFFERYTFLDDSTLLQHTFADSTLAVVSDSAVIAVRDGQVREPLDAPRWQATAFDSVSWRFESLELPGRAFTWRTTGPDSWTALLESRDASGTPQEVVYVLERVR